MVQARGRARQTGDGPLRKMAQMHAQDSAQRKVSGARKVGEGGREVPGKAAPASANGADQTAQRGKRAAPQAEAGGGNRPQGRVTLVIYGQNVSFLYYFVV